MSLALQHERANGRSRVTLTLTFPLPRVSRLKSSVVLLALAAFLIAQTPLALARTPIAAAAPQPSLSLSPAPLSSLSGLCHSNSQATNPAAAEDDCAGTLSWKASLPTGPSNAIMGYTAPASVNRGQDLHLFVSTLAASYEFNVYRMGWYQGDGASLVYMSPSLPGIDQPAPTIDPRTRMVSADDWHDPVTIHIPATWPSGVYVIKLISATGYMRYVPFVVRDDASHAQILIVIPFMTYQAYNLWGGYSLYMGANHEGEEEVSANRAYVVSFDRPYASGEGLGDFLTWDYDTIGWFERMGYDVTYMTDADLATHRSALLNHRLIIISGHAEYWSTTMRAAVTSARDAGISLGFFGGNDMYWHVRLQPSPLGANREVVCYRVAALDPLASTDPAEATVQWRQAPLNQPESALMGAMYVGIYRTDEGLPDTFTANAVPLLVGTGLKAGSSLPGLVGIEVDAVYGPSGATPFGLTTLAASYIPGHYSALNVCSACGSMAAMTLYTAPSGARVFDAGSLRFSWALSTTASPSWPANVRSAAAFQRFMENLIAYLLYEPLP